MAKISSKLIIVIGLIASFVSIFGFVKANLLDDSNGDFDSTVLFPSKPEVKCTVKIDNDAFSKIDIEQANCIKTGDTCRALLSFSTLGLFSDKGTIRATATDDAAIKSFEISAFEEQTHELKLCTTASSVNIDVVQESNVVDSKVVNIV